jgi:DmsE family decaheme c-type cytochrome
LIEVNSSSIDVPLVWRQFEREGTMNTIRVAMLGVIAVLFAAPALADEAAPPTDPSRVCTRCHDETEQYPVLSILKSKHAVMADEHTPFADQACMTCHGTSEDHRTKTIPGAGRRMSPDIVFGKNADTPVAQKNQVCLGCHETAVRMHWKGSKHETEGVACSSCHTLHAGHDPVLDKLTQSDTCFECHKQRRAEIFLPSSHPIREGKVSCSDCHAPHGSNGPMLLAKSTVNETCYTCHAEKRGPFLWEHEPAREDCANCHKPHGSVNASLLKQRSPYLCQQCHTEPQHPSTLYSGTGLPGATTPSGAQQLLGKGCTNCHSEVHGSNHPSGVRKTR